VVTEWQSGKSFLPPHPILAVVKIIVPLLAMLMLRSSHSYHWSYKAFLVKTDIRFSNFATGHPRPIAILACDGKHRHCRVLATVIRDDFSSTVPACLGFIHEQICQSKP